MSNHSTNEDPSGISPDSGRLLVRLARHTVSKEKGIADRFNLEDVWNDPLLQVPGRAFVSLDLNGKLRGCIGFLEPQGRLYEVVERAALNAAFKDPRFPPLEREEITEVQFEVSVLTAPIEDLGDRASLPDRIVLGRHGLIIGFKGQKGVLLPQVPLEWGWDVQQFLEKTCMKAGLPISSWKDPRCHVSLFSSRVFREQDHHTP